ncbi:MAG: DUF255 domain-containing protein [Planctomycetota bacterium]|nr:DUF255 domain-containing protein [Planctomycetota bacterium]
MPQGAPPAHTNQLSAEDSPYLLQHAHNPVDWMPWGDAAFAEARRRGVPILVSVGYSSCYWCHVMERESFEDAAVGAYLNANFVSIKVDREQRPDVDAIMMASCQAYTAATEGRASGGWPLTIFLEPATLKPFFAGTYFPKSPSHGKPSFVQLLERIHSAWDTERPQLEEQADRLSAAVTADLSATAAPVRITTGIVNQAGEALLRYADSTNGGFGGAPKFPQPAYMEFLAQWQPSGPARQHLDFTLEKMALGGVADQLGGGFHRYAVDGTWTVPHFEKMLYDQAQLLPLYAEAAKRTGNPLFAQVCEGVVSSLQRECLRPDGLFDSSMDAEVDGREGGSFLWSPDEARAALTAAGLPEPEVKAAMAALGLTGRPNFRDPHHPEAAPAWVLTMTSAEASLAPATQRARAALLAVRDQRKQPRRDDKAILGWNGLMIAGLADAGANMDRPDWTRLAADAATAALETFRSADGTWRHAKRQRVDLPATLEDLACLIRGLHALADATGDPMWRARALQVAADARTSFLDEATSRWYESAPGRIDLFVRPAGLHDGAVPSGPGEMMAQLPWLASIDPSGEWSRVMDRTFTAASGAIAASPVSTCRSLVGLLRSGQLSDSPPETANRDRQASPIEVTATGTAISFRMPDGWKIIASAPAGTGLSLVPLAITSQTRDVRVDWTMPPVQDAADGSRVLGGSFTIPLRMSGSGAAAGQTVAISVRWQACTETMCLPPEERTLTVIIPGD